MVDLFLQIDRVDGQAPWQFNTTYNLIRTAEGWSGGRKQIRAQSRYQFVSRLSGPASMSYRVIVADNFHYMDGGDMTVAGEFETSEEALATAMKIALQGAEEMTAPLGC